MEPGLIPDHRKMDPNSAFDNATKGIEMGNIINLFSYS